MWLDLAALGIVLAAIAVGLVRGTLVASVRLAGAAVAYLGSWKLAPVVAPWIEAQLGLGGTLAFVAAGIGCFGGLLLTMELLTALARSVDRRMRDGAARPPLDRVGGALVSAVAGFAFAVLVGWLAFTVDALRVQGGDDSLPSTEGSRFAPIARDAIRSLGEWALSDHGPTGAAVARAASDPVETLGRVERLMDNPHLADLRDDRGFWQQVESGDYEGAVRRASFLALAYDGTTRQELAGLGLIGQDAAASSRAFRDDSVEALSAVGPRLRALRNDPALARLAEDPEVQEMVMANDTLGLLRHPDVREVIARALAGPSEDV